jgi:hypothetical protein
VSPPEKVWIRGERRSNPPASVPSTLAEENDDDGTMCRMQRSDEKLTVEIEYLETVDAMLDGYVKTRENPNDPGSRKLWLKDRVLLLLAELESTANKLSDVWIQLDQYARGGKFTPEMAEMLLRQQKVQGWR